MVGFFNWVGNDIMDYVIVLGVNIYFVIFSGGYVCFSGIFMVVLYVVGIVGFLKSYDFNLIVVIIEILLI